MDVFIAACGGGRESIVKEIFSKWIVKEDDDKEREGETKRSDSMKKEIERCGPFLTKKSVLGRVFDVHTHPG